MEGNIFINEAIDHSIAKYLANKNNPDGEEFNSFLVIVVRALIFIYGELDIINPYKTKDESGLGGFNANLKKFGLTDQKLENFKTELLNYYHSEQNMNILPQNFLNIQKNIIDMFVLKKAHVFITDEEVIQFRNLLYTKEETNSYKQKLYQQLTPDSNEVVYYMNSKLFELKHNFILTEYNDIALDPEAYKIAGYNAAEVIHMNTSEIENINNNVYNFFRIKPTDVNKKERLKSAIQYYQKYGNRLTSGNGYIDMLLLTGVVATGLMFMVIVAMRLMR